MQDKKTETLFEKILNKTLPATIVYEDESVLAFKDIAPMAPIHVLVIPKKKYPGFASLASATEAEVGAFIVRIAKVAQALGLDESGYRVVFNQGHDGQQTVSYIHAHILGGRTLSWPPG